MSVSAIPAGYHTITPYLCVGDSAAAIEFYKAAFGAVELMRLTMPGGGIAHAEIRIGDSPVMLSDENPEWGNKSPLTLGGVPGGLGMYVPDVDEAFKTALAAGAKELRPVQDQFYGDRSGTLTDPFGYTWTLGTHKEDLSETELQSRLDAMIKGS